MVSLNFLLKIFKKNQSLNLFAIFFSLFLFVQEETKKKVKLNCIFVAKLWNMKKKKRKLELICYFELDVRRARTNGENSLVENAAEKCKRCQWCSTDGRLCVYFPFEFYCDVIREATVSPWKIWLWDFFCYFFFMDARGRISHVHLQSKNISQQESGLLVLSWSFRLIRICERNYAEYLDCPMKIKWNKTTHIQIHFIFSNLKRRWLYPLWDQSKKKKILNENEIILF